jgi:hypothetical protein
MRVLFALLYHLTPSHGCYQQARQHPMAAWASEICYGAPGVYAVQRLVARIQDTRRGIPWQLGDRPANGADE